MPKLPQIRTGKSIAVICEGYEEFDYLDRLKQCLVWDGHYNIKLYNAKSIDNISAVYQNVYQTAACDATIIYCDTENPPFKKFECLKRKLNAFHDRNVAERLIIFANPCTMQIILSHFGKVRLECNSKSENSPTIKSLTGVSNYRAERKQRAAIMKQITADNYRVMKNNLVGLGGSYTVVPSTNAVERFERLEGADDAWIDDINSALE